EWGTSGAGLEVLPISSANHHSFVTVAPAPTNDAIVAWLEYSGASSPMVVDATRLDETGAAVWSPGTLGVATTLSTKGRLSLSGVAGSDMLVATWQDNAAGTNDVKAQNINMDGTLGIPPCPGDVNGDHLVDLSDLAVLLAHFGMSSGALLGDGDLD